MKRTACVAAVLCAAAVIMTASAMPAAADFVFFKDGRMIGGEMLITPSVLRFRMTARYVDLYWAPPSYPVRSYLVYMRRGTGDFLFAGKTARTRIRLRGLECGTEYTVHVTSIDANHRESAPSNDVRIVTFAGRPGPPRRLRVVGVTGGAGGTSARLAWDGAVDTCGGPAREYFIYISPPADARKDAGRDPGKERGRKAAQGPDPRRFPGFVPAGKTTGTAFTLEGLRKDLRYTVMVTSVDASGSESAAATIAFNPPGSEAPQPNRRPADPFPVGCLKVVLKDGTEPAARIFWGAARDPDGSISAYRVYRNNGSAYELAGSTGTTDLLVRGLPSAGTQSFVVRAVDDRGLESVNSVRVATGMTFPVTVSARALFMVPAGDFGRFFMPGFGGMLHAGVGLDDFSVGVEAGYLHFGGRTGRITGASLVPFALAASYGIRVSRWLSIEPGIVFGGSRLDARVAPVRTLLGQVPLYERRSAVEPMFGVGAAIIFAPLDLMLVETRVEYRGIIERSGLTGFFQISAGAGVRIDTL